MTLGVAARLVLVGAAVLALGRAAAAAPPDGGPFLVGFAEDLPKELGAAATAPMRGLGAGAVRLTLRWAPGQTTLAAGDAAQLDRAVGASGGLRVVLAVYGTSAAAAPQDAAARDAYCAYVRSALARYPAIGDVIVWNEPNTSLFWRPQFAADGSSAAPAAYAALLARCWDVLHAFRAGVNVIGPATSANGSDNPSAGSNVAHSPGAFIRALGDAYRASGRTLPLLDTVAHHPYGADPTERPWRRHIGSKAIGLGDWNKLMHNLSVAFDGTAQPLPGACRAGRCVALWYSEHGFQTVVDEDRRAAYTGTETETTAIPDDAGGEPEGPQPETSAAPDQRTQVLDAVRLAACQPFVGAYLSFLLADEPILSGWQSGALWADRTAKGSEPAFRQAFGEAASGTVDCGALKGGPPSPDFRPPTAPDGLTAAAGQAPLRVDLAWRAAADETGVTAYRVSRNGGHVATASPTSWVDTAVAPGATVTYVVRALDAAGNLGDPSAPVTVAVPAEAPPPPPAVPSPAVPPPAPAPTPPAPPAAPGPDVTAPSRPGVLKARTLRRPLRIRLRWGASSDETGAPTYRVSRNGVVRATVAAPAWVDRAVVPGRRYVYVVRALDGAGNRSAARRAAVRLAPPPR